jgi:hypothetical protein
MAGFRSPKEFRKKGKDGLGGLEELHAGAVPDHGQTVPATNQRASNHLAAEPYRPPGSAKLHVAESPGWKGQTVFDEEAIPADIQGLQRRLVEETDLQGLLWPDALRAPALPMWSRDGRAASEPAEPKIGERHCVAGSLRELGCASRDGSRTLACWLEFIEATPWTVSRLLHSPPDRIPTKLTNPVAHTSSKPPRPPIRSRISSGRAGLGSLGFTLM